MIEGTEIDLDDFGLPESRELLRSEVLAAANQNDNRYFGLELYGATNRGRLGYVVGVGRLHEAADRVIIVNPRSFGAEPNQFQIDYLKMYAVCAEHAEVSQHLDECLTIYPNEAAVDAQGAENWSPLIALAFLKALHELVQRHLRRGFVTREDDLRSKIQGQINFNRYVTGNLVSGHPEIIPCRFQELESDTLENRILRTALAASRRLLDRATGIGSAWHVWARQADRALAGAAITRVTQRDMHRARRTGTYRHYARPLNLAKAVLTHVGFDPNNPLEPQSKMLLPFRLVTYELFERYVEVFLRNANPQPPWVGYHDKNIGDDFMVRPDFLVSTDNHRIIVDAKYKNFGSQQPGRADDENSFRSDVYQLMAYAKHKLVKKRFDEYFGEDNNDLAALLIYPSRREHRAQGNPSQQNWLDLIFQQAGDRELSIEKYSDFDINLIKVGVPVPCIGH